MNKEIKINPTLFKLKKTKKKKEPSSNKNVNILLKRIKEHASTRNKQASIQTTDNSKNNFESHINYLEDLKHKKKKKQTQINSSDKKNLEIKTETLPISNKDTIIHKPANLNSITTKEDPPYGILKNGPKPTYREWKKKTQRNIRTDLENSVKIFNQANDKKKESIQILNKSKKYKYKLGKSSDKKIVSVLIKNRKTQKRIKEETDLLNKAPITEVKDYLKKHFLYKSGSNAPPDVLREIYKSAHLAGKPVINTNRETLLHNFYKLDNE